MPYATARSATIRLRLCQDNHHQIAITHPLHTWGDVCFGHVWQAVEALHCAEQAA